MVIEENFTNYDTDVKHVRTKCGHKVLQHFTSKKHRNLDDASLTSLLVLLQRSLNFFFFFSFKLENKANHLWSLLWMTE